jgi:hypothetical protein
MTGVLVRSRCQPAGEQGWRGRGGQVAGGRAGLLGRSVKAEAKEEEAVERVTQWVQVLDLCELEAAVKEGIPARREGRGGRGK